MGQGFNLIGAYVVKYRYQRGWTQEALAAKLQRLGCDVTAQVLANIETRRCGANDTLIGYLAKAFQVGVDELFPPSWQSKPSPLAKRVASQSVGGQRKKTRPQ
jgi:transcriptional regulator with XRE-family HTH domain